MFPAYFQRLAAYNQWANQTLYAVAGDLPEVDCFQEQGAFFGSLHGTLTHILVADRIWLRRLTGAGETYTDLSAKPFDDLASLWDARKAEDQRIIDWVGSLSDADFDRPFSYANMAGDPFTSPLDLLLSHFFNHQTHHRGQAHALISALGHEAPSMDMIYFTRR